ACLDRFTPGQKERMIAALTGIRASLLKSIACIPPNAPPLSDFSNTNCIGTVQFSDQSINATTSWSWTFQNGTPATSTDKNPVVSFPGSGAYEVTLTATNA